MGNRSSVFETPEMRRERLGLTESAQEKERRRISQVSRSRYRSRRISQVSRSRRRSAGE